MFLRFQFFLFLVAALFSYSAKTQACYMINISCGPYPVAYDANGEFTNCIHGSGNAECVETPIDDIVCFNAQLSCPTSLPGSPAVSDQTNDDQPPVSCGSHIDVNQQVLGETIPVTGTPFSLVYSSDRVPGRTSWYTWTIPITGGAVSPTLVKETLTLNVGSRQITQVINTPGPNYTYNFVWDGKDASGNVVTGSLASTYSFVETNNPPSPYEVPQVGSTILGFNFVNSLGLGGWMISVLHSYDPVRQVLYRGDGTAVNSASQASGSNLMVASSDGSEIYIFSPSGKHLQTLTGITGSVKYNFGYDSSNRLISITDAYNNKTTLTRSSGVLTNIISPYNVYTTVTIGSDGNLASVKNQNNETYNMTYFSGSLLETFQKPKGETSSFTYDSLGRLLSDSSTAGSLLSYVRALTTSGWLVTETSKLNRVKTSSISDAPASYVRQDNYPDGSSLNYSQSPGTTNIISTYNGGASTLQQTKTPDVRLGALAPIYSNTQFYSGSQNSEIVNQTQVMNPSTTNNIFSFQTLENDFSTNGAPLLTNVYTASSHTYLTTSSEGRKSTTVTDGNEKIISTQSASYLPIKYTYDSHGRLSKNTQGSRLTTYSYNAQGYLLSVENALNQTVSFAYEQAGRVKAQTLPDSRVIDFTYDPDGNLETVTPPGKTAHTILSNLFDLISKYTPPALAGTVSSYYTYNNDKQLTLVTRPDGKTIQYNYDPTSSLLTSMTIPTGTNSFSYSNGHLVYASTYDGTTTSLGLQGDLYNEFQLSFPAVNSDLTWSFDNYFRVSSQRLYTNANIAYQTSFAYDNDSLLTQAGSEVLVPDAVTGKLDSTTLGGIKDTFSYSSDFGELSSHTSKYNSAPLYSEAFTRDLIGRIATRTEQIGGGSIKTYVYTYDPSGRLTDVTTNGTETSHYSYDTNSNRLTAVLAGTTTSGTYDAQDRLTVYGTKKYTYTANGELLTKTDSSNNQTTNYTYDVLGNLKQVSLPSGEKVTYLVDGLNRRVAKEVNGVIQKYYVYQGLSQVAAELDVNGNVTAQYIYGSSANVPDYVVKGSNTYRMITNHLGSPVMVVNDTTGAIAEQITYDEFGNITADTSPGFTCFGFAGGLYDPDTKLVRFGARDYDAVTGRWTSKDPILFSGGDSNLYGYVLQDPVNGIDPLGLWTLQVGFAFNRQAGPTGAVGGIGFAFDSSGAFGTYNYGGGTAGLGATSGYGLSIQTSNAQSIMSLQGRFNVSSVNGGEGIGGGIDFFNGFDSNGSYISGQGFTFGAQGGASACGGQTYTNINQLNGK